MKQKTIIFFHVINLLIFLFLLTKFFFHNNNNDSINKEKLILFSNTQLQNIEKLQMINNNSNESITMNINEPYFTYFNFDSEKNIILPLDKQHKNLLIKNLSDSFDVYKYKDNQKINLQVFDYAITIFVKGKGEARLLFYKDTKNSRFINIHIEKSNNTFLIEDNFSDLFNNLINYFTQKELIIENDSQINSINFTDYISETNFNINSEKKINELNFYLNSLRSNNTLLDVPAYFENTNEIVIKFKNNSQAQYQIYKSDNQYFWKINSDEYSYSKEISEYTYSKILENFFK